MLLLIARVHHWKPSTKYIGEERLVQIVDFQYFAKVRYEIQTIAEMANVLFSFVILMI